MTPRLSLSYCAAVFSAITGGTCWSLERGRHEGILTEDLLRIRVSLFKF